MPTAADFSVVVGSGIEKVAAENGPIERQFDFDIPANFVGNTRTSAILHFTAHPSREPDDLFQVQFSINGRRVYRYGPSSADFVRSFSVVFGSSVLTAGTNVMTVKRTHGEATLGVSSVVVWFKTDTSAGSPARGKPAPAVKAPRVAGGRRTRAKT